MKIHVVKINYEDEEFKNLHPQSIGDGDAPN